MFPICCSGRGQGDHFSAGLISPSNPIILQHVVSKKGMFPTPFIWRLELDPSFDAAVPINITNYAPPHSGFTTDDLKERNATTVICAAAAAPPP